MTRTTNHRRLAAAIGGAVLVTVFAALPANAAAPPPTVAIQDGGDGYINAAEEGSVMLTGTYSLLAIPPITSIEARIVGDVMCADILAPSTPTLVATMFLDGTWQAGPFDLSTFPQGPVCARARAYDMNGPGGTGTSAPKIKDTIAPPSGSVTIHDGGDGLINAAEAAAGVPVSWTTAGDGVAAKISFEDSLPSIPGPCLYTDAPISGPGAQMPTGCLNALVDGLITMRGVWLDAAGNESSVASDTSLLDANAPAIGDVSLADPNFDGYANKEEVQSGKIVGAWSNPDPDAVSSEIKFRDAFGAIHSPECGPFANPENGFHTLTQACADKMAQGPFEFAVKWFDLAGNESPEGKASLILDTINPILEIHEPLEGSWQPSTVHVRGLSEVGAKLTFQLDGDPVVNGLPRADGTFEHIFHNVSDGAHFVTVTATDVASNTIAMGANFMVDHLIPYIRNPRQGSLQPEVVTFNGTGDPDSQVEILEGGTLVGRAEVASNGEWQTTIAFYEGTHTVRARATDAFGVPTSELGPERTFIVVPALPSVTIETEDMSLNPLQINGTATSPKGVTRVRIEYFDALGGAKLATANADCYDCGPGAKSVEWIHSVPERLSIGLIRAEVTAYDTVGQKSTTKAIRFLYNHRL